LYVYVSVCSRHETEPTVVILIDRRHGNWSSVKSILHALNVSDVTISVSVSQRRCFTISCYVSFKVIALIINKLTSIFSFC